MTWVAMTIPDDAADLPGWLESHLVGPDLGRLIEELRAVQGKGPPLRSLDALLGDRTTAVLERGLSVLPRQAIRELLRFPDLLLDLQTLVLVEGGVYWSDLPVAAEFAQIADRGWERLQAVLHPAGVIPSRTQPASRPGLLRRFLPYVLTSLATAAAVLVATPFTRIPSPRAPEQSQAPTWGWQKADALPQDLDRTAYLNRLADEADEWFGKRPTTPMQLAQRLGEFREGCSVLLLSEHRPLPEADRTWLKDRCQAWAKKIDSLLVRLEETGTVEETLEGTDTVVRQLTKALRERAA
jgi:hypothetical protein